MKTRELIARNLKYLRYKKGQSQEEFYTSYNLSFKYLAMVERGEVNITVDFLDRLTKKLNIDITELIKDDKSRIIDKKRIDSKML